MKINQVHEKVKPFYVDYLKQLQQIYVQFGVYKSKFDVCAG
jgi:hypothetical protein